MKRLEELEHENSRLKRLCSDLSLENTALKDLIEKALRPAERRDAVAHVLSHGLSVQQACQAVGLARASYYRPRVDWTRQDAAVMAAVTTLLEDTLEFLQIEVVRRRQR